MFPLPLTGKGTEQQYLLLFLSKMVVNKKCLQGQVCESKGKGTKSERDTNRGISGKKKKKRILRVLQLGGCLETRHPVLLGLEFHVLT